MVSSHKKAGLIGLIAGILLIMAGLSGAAAWSDTKDFVTENIVDNEYVDIIFAVLLFVASLGGIAVILGSILISKEKTKIGKFTISLGAGMGLFGLIIALVIAISEQSPTIAGFASTGGIGIILSIYARRLA